MGSKIPAICKPSDSKRVLRLPVPLRIGEKHRLLRPGEVFRSVNPGGQLHGLGAPAITFSDGGYGWWQHGLAHRDGDLPALCVTACNPMNLNFPTGVNVCPHAESSLLDAGVHIWCTDGFIHRDGLPAIRQVLPDGWTREDYWQNGRRHNATGPAVSHPENSSWFYHDLSHNAAGPAIRCKVDNAWSECWCWYGDLLLVEGEIRPSFAFSDALVSYLLKALLEANFSDNLIRSLLLMQPHVIGRMPDFQQHIANCCDEISWALFQARIRNVLNAGAIQESYDYSFAL